MFYYRIKGDLFKYLAQISDDSDYLYNQAEACFRKSINLADLNLEELSPLRLFSYLTLAIFYSKYLDNDDYAMTVLNTIRKSKMAVDYYNDNLEQPIEKQSMNILREILQMTDNNAPIE